MNLQIKRILDGGNTLTIFFEESKSLLVLENVLTFMLSSDFKYSYIVFGYNEWNFDLSPYFVNYSKLQNENNGIIKLKNEDRKNLQFIYEMLNNYQMVALYINNYEDMVDKFDFGKWRNSYGRANSGYCILEMSFNYIVIDKDADLPDWDLQKLKFSL